MYNIFNYNHSKQKFRLVDNDDLDIVTHCRLLFVCLFCFLQDEVGEGIETRCMSNNEIRPTLKRVENHVCSLIQAQRK